MNPRYASVAIRAQHRCEYCHAPESIFNFPFEIEHIIPTGQSGADVEENWALACRSCNLFKSNEVTGLDPETGEAFPLFHPRQQSWDEHFAITELGNVAGLTPSGRATAARLRMNSTSQSYARQQWIRLGLFP